jgi:hypothetical protein
MARQDKRRRAKTRPPLDSGPQDSLPRWDVRPWTAYAGAAFLALALMAPSMVHWGTDYLGSERHDMARAYRHFVDFAVRSVRGGEVPLWNPYIFCGAPFLPNTSATIFSPLNGPILLALPAPLSVNLCLSLQFVLLALGMVHWVRARGSSNAAALGAGVVVAMSALLVPRVFAGHFTIVCTAAWIPLVFWAQERLMRFSSAASAVVFGVVAALMCLGGHLQYTYYAALLLALNLLAWTTKAEPGTRLRFLLRQAGLHALAAALAFALTAMELLPVLDTQRFSARQPSGDPAWLRLFSMPVENLATFLAPAVFGQRTDYWGRWYWWEVCYYVGIAPLVFAVVAVVRQFRLRKPDTTLVLFSLALFLAIAGMLPGASRLAALIPGWGVFRGHAKIGGFAMVFATALAANGFDLVRANLRAFAGRASAVLFGAVGIGCCVLFAWMGNGYWRQLLASPAVNADRVAAVSLDDTAAFAKTLALAVESSHRSLLLAAVFAAAGLLLVTAGRRAPQRLWCAAAALLVLADLGTFALRTANWSFVAKPGRIPEPAALLFSARFAGERVELPGIGLINDGISIRAAGVGGNDVTLPRAYNTFLDAHMGGRALQPHFDVALMADSPMLDAANLALLAVAQPEPPGPLESYESMGDYGGLRVWKRRTSLPRAFVVGGARWVPDNEDRIFDALIAGVDYHREALLVGESDGAPGESFEAVPAAVTYPDIHHAEVRAPRAGWLVLSDGYDSRWHASVDGTEVEVLRANGAFRAVKVHAGQNVLFEYRAPAFATGAWISAMAWLAVASWAVWTALAEKLRSRSGRSPAAGSVT